jgi:transposase
VQKGDVESFSLCHLPIVKEYASRIGLVELVDRMVASGMHVAPGKVLLGLVMNLLCGRSPLYRVEEFFRSRDVALLLGEDMTAELLNDDTIGRVLDRIYAYGTWKIFSEVCLHAFRNFHVDASVVHQDTTSVSVWGEYQPAAGDPIHITNGFSKDKRPDLKQFVLSLLCVEGNLPCHAGILDGNASDKKTNGRILNELPRIMARHGVKEFIYVADSALITKDNLALMNEGIDFIARLPENFGVCGKLIRAAVASCSWQEVGHLTHRNVRGKEVSACYRFKEERLDLYGRTYRAVVVHSDVHDRRRQKRIDSAIQKDALLVKATASMLARKEFFCLPDAHAAAQALKNGALHQVSSSVESRPVYGRGRPPKSGVRPVKGLRYRVLPKVTENKTAVDKLREEAGCFVLLTTVPSRMKSGRDILRIYKEQDGIERNFAFLKDPLVANDVFLKKPHRIEAMGLVLVLSLLLWRLMERTMRRKARENNIMLQGWNNSDTTKPTSFMMVSKFSPVFVGVKEDRRFLFTPLDTVQLAYLMALDVHPAVFTEVIPRTDRSRSRSP